MAKNKQRMQQLEAQKKAAPTGFKAISPRGWKVIAAGIGIAALGFYVLSLTDPAGQNWASNLCPFLILGGYAVIGLGIVL